MTSGKLKFLMKLRGPMVRLLFCVFFVTTSTVFTQRASGGEVQVQKCWEHSAGSDSLSNLRVFGETIFSIREGSVVEAIAGDSGKLLWSNDVGGTVVSDLVSDGVSVYFVRRAGGAKGAEPEADLIAISANSGITRWQRSLGADGDHRLAITKTGIVALSDSGSLWVVSSSDGTVTSSRKLISPVSLGTSVLGVNTIGATNEREIISIEGSQTPMVRGRSDFAITALRSNGDDELYYGNDRGILVRLDGTSSKIIWQFKSGGAISDILVADHQIITSSNDNFVYAFAPYNGARLWKRRVAGRVSALRMVGQDLLLVQPLGDGNIVLINTKNGRIAGQIPFTDGESVIDSAVIDSNRIVVSTGGIIYGYAVGGCPTVKQNGPGM
ncbi:MAG: PQQ-binding-like beta-propeller repeat protein [Chloracidobacterium sp.]|nr:PQQ-binding-like beta-propeller repeat protein [Chloracidobacterium sp.]